MKRREGTQWWQDMTIWYFPTIQGVFRFSTHPLQVDIGTYAEVNGSSVVAAQDDSSDDEDDSKPEIKKPQDDLDDFLDDVSAQPGDYEAL